MLERIPAVQFVSSGEQNCESTKQGGPLVTLWPLSAQVHRTVSPTEMLTVSGTKTSPPCPTATSTIWLVAAGTPLTAGRPFWSTRWISCAEVSFCCVVLRRLSRDSACDRNTIKNIVARQTATRTTAFNRFMFLFLFCAPALRIFFFRTDTEPQLALSDSAWRRDAAQRHQRNASKIFSARRCKTIGSCQKKVTEPLPHTGRSRTFR